MLNEVLEGLFRLLRRDRPVEMRKRARVVCTVALVVSDGGLRDCIRREWLKGSLSSWACDSEGSAIFLVEVPGAADGFVANHQRAGALAHVVVELSQPQALVVGSPMVETLAID